MNRGLRVGALNTVYERLQGDRGERAHPEAPYDLAAGRQGDASHGAQVPQTKHRRGAYQQRAHTRTHAPRAGDGLWPRGSIRLVSLGSSVGLRLGPHEPPRTIGSYVVLRTHSLVRYMSVAHLSHSLSLTHACISALLLILAWRALKVPRLRAYGNAPGK